MNQLPQIKLNIRYYTENGRQIKRYGIHWGLVDCGGFGYLWGNQTNSSIGTLGFYL